jgi:ribosome maturation factor RimP
VGRVVGVDDAGVMVEVAGDKAGEKVVLAHEGLGPGRVQVEFNRLDDVADEELADFDDGVEDEER